MASHSEYTGDTDVSELLKEVETSHDTQSKLQEAAKSLIHTVSNLQANVPLQSVESQKLLRLYGDVYTPSQKHVKRSRDPDTERGSMFVPTDEPPRMIGSVAVGAETLPDPKVDVCFTLPKAMIKRQKAHLDHSFHCCRVAWLAHVAYMLRYKHSDAWSNVLLTVQHGDLRKPMIECTHLHTGSRVTALVAPPDGVVQTKRLSKSHGNMKPPQLDAENPRPASPLYNHALLEDARMLPIADAIEATVKRVPIAREATILLKRWFYQRGLLSPAEGITGHALIAFAARLAENGTVKLAMSPLQAFRACIWALSKGHLQAHGATVAGVNAFAKASSSLLLDIEQEAAASYKQLCKRTADSVHAALLDGTQSALRCDLLANVQLQMAAKCSNESDWLRCHDEPPWVRQEREVEKLASQALGSRAQLVRCQPRCIDRWPTADDHSPAQLLSSQIILRILLAEPKQAFRMVDLGPSNEDQDEAAAFREFWGDKAELRRFKDGTIAEAAVWECPDDDRHHIPGRVLEHVFQRHMNRQLVSFNSSAGMFDHLLPRIPRESHSTNITKAIDSLHHSLSALKTVPLQVTSLSQVSPCARGTWPAAAAKHPLAESDPTAAQALSSRRDAIPAHITCIHALALVEPSAQWPSEHDAASMTLTALAAQIAKELSERHVIPAYADSECFDAFVDGFALRVRLRAESKGPMHVGPQEMHSSAMLGVVGEHAPAAPASRLLARWASSQLLAPHVPHEAIEALVASVFLSPNSCTPPRSREAGFVRALARLAWHDWQHFALRVPLGGEPPETTKREEVDNKGMQICTACDSTSALTNKGPAPTVVARAVRLASKAIKVWTLCGTTESGIPHASDAIKVARPALGDFDAVLSMDLRSAPPDARAVYPIVPAAQRAGKVVNGWQQQDSQNKEGSKSEDTNMRLDRIPKKAAYGGLTSARAATLVGLEPVVQLADEIELRFDGAARVFFDPVSCDGLAIALVPSYFQREHSKARKANGSFKKRKRMSWELYQENPPRKRDVLMQIAWLAQGLATHLFTLKPNEIEDG